MRPITLFFAALALLAAAVPAQERVAQLSTIDGKVQIVRSADGRKDTARQVGNRVRNGSVFAGDVVTTASGASATLAFSDGSEVKMKDSSALTVQEVDLSALASQGRIDKPIGRRIKVLAGEIWTHVVPNPQVATEFETPSGVAAVKGTEFVISVAREPGVER